MTAPIVEYRASSSAIQQEIITTWILLEADPLVTHLAPPFEAFYQRKWLPVVAKETELTVQAHRADALVDVVDQGLDDFVDELDTVLLRLVDKERWHPLYAYFFGIKRPHELKRPIWGGQLETMRLFIQPLKTSTHAELVTLGATLEPLVANADAAVKSQHRAAEAIKTFRILGERKTCLEELNALRQATAGTLSEMPHKHPEKRLPGDYADRFFKRTPRRGKTAAKEVTSADLHANIAEHEQILAALKAQLEDVLAKEEADNRNENELKALQTQLAAAEKAAADATARIAALKSKMD